MAATGEGERTQAGSGVTAAYGEEAASVCAWPFLKRERKERDGLYSGVAFGGGK